MRHVFRDSHLTTVLDIHRGPIRPSPVRVVRCCHKLIWPTGPGTRHQSKEIGTRTDSCGCARRTMKPTQFWSCRFVRAVCHTAAMARRLSESVFSHKVHKDHKEKENFVSFVFFVAELRAGTSTAARYVLSGQAPLGVTSRNVAARNFMRRSISPP